MKLYRNCITIAVASLLCGGVYAYKSNPASEIFEPEEYISGESEENDPDSEYHDILNDEEDPIRWTGDIYKIPDEELEETMEFLEDIGGKMLFHRGDLYLLMYPEDYTLPDEENEADEIEEGPESGDFNEEIEDSESGELSYSERRPSFRSPKSKQKLKLPEMRSRRPMPTMEKARFSFNANFIHEGEGLPCPFDGSGVVVGFSDTGFDPNHSNFLNYDGTETRVRKFVHYEVAEGRIDEMDTPEEYTAFRTDYPDTHATHVAGIMAGRGADGKYVGMAPGADIVATTSDLYDVGILAGVEEIIAYAKSVGSPAVINLSIGNYTGAHDGSSLFNQYLDRCADDAIICISTGNEGSETHHIGHTFRTDSDKVTFRVKDQSWAYLDFQGLTDVYSSDDRPVEVRLYFRSSSAEIFTTPWINLAETPEWVLTSDPEKEKQDSRFHFFEGFADHFNGEIYVVGGIDPNNGRYCATLQYDAHTDEVVPGHAWGPYGLWGDIRGVEGQHVDLYADGVYSSFRDPCTPSADSKRSVSDLATGYRVIQVGSYDNTDACLDGSRLNVSWFSGYGTLDDGRVLPLTCAPGNPIISSYSSVYMENREPSEASFEHEGHYWGTYGGTSMSTPYVAGGIATWLQADPTLTSEEVRDIIIKSNNSEDYPLEANPQHGHGFFDPYRGLQMIVKKSMTDVQTLLSRSLFASFSNGILKISNIDSRNVAVNLYSLDGRKISECHPGNSTDIVLPAEALSLNKGAGVIICKISAEGATPEILKFIY